MTLYTSDDIRGCITYVCRCCAANDRFATVDELMGRMPGFPYTNEDSFSHHVIWGDALVPCPASILHLLLRAPTAEDAPAKTREYYARLARRPKQKIDKENPLLVQRGPLPSGMMDVRVYYSKEDAEAAGVEVSEYE